MPQLKGKKYVQITSEIRDGVAHIRLVDTISEGGEASSSQVRLQVDSFLSQGITRAEVYANGRGGDCFEATEIANELERFGMENVSIRVGALAASAYTYLVAKFHTKANPNSQFMIHRPSMGTYGNLAELESDIVLLRNTTAQYRTAYAQKTGKTEDEIDTLWAKGDVWLTAQQALELKLIDVIEGDDELEITAEVRTMLEACGAPVIPELTNTEKTMDRKLMIAALGLDADATDEQILAAVTAAKKAQDDAAEVEETAEEKATAAAKKLVAKYVGLKHITAELAPGYETFAKHDPQGCEAALKALKPVKQLSAELNNKLKTDAATIEARAGWSYDEWMDKDPKGLEALADTDPEQFKQLFSK